MCIVFNNAAHVCISCNLQGSMYMTANDLECYFLRACLVILRRILGQQTPDSDATDWIKKKNPLKRSSRELGEPGAIQQCSV